MYSVSCATACAEGEKSQRDTLPASPVTIVILGLTAVRIGHSLPGSLQTHRNHSTSSTCDISLFEFHFIVDQIKTKQILDFFKNQKTKKKTT